MRIFLLFFLFISSLVSGQVTDSFSDGNFNAAPTWNGDATEFMINASQQLQLNNTVAGASYLSTSSPTSSLNNIQWNFYIKQTFAPSSSNYGRVYLASDQANLEGSLNGYYLQFGETGSLDAVELFKQTGLTSTSIARGTDGRVAASFSIGIKVTRDAAGNWSLYVDPAGGTAYVLEDTGTDNTYTTTSFFGVASVYTISNITKFFFDDFYNGALIVDIAPPTIVSSTVISTTQLDVLFSEGVDPATSQTLTNYTANNGLGNPSSAMRDAGNFSLVHLTFATPFTNGLSNTLTINNVEDLNSNAITTETTNFTLVMDVTPPSIVSSTVISNTQLDILFDETVDLTSAQTLINYSADNGLGNPSSALRDASNLALVHLTFGIPFTNALTNTLTVNNVQDLNGNAISAGTTSFTYFAPVTSVFKDVIITEIYADPSPLVALPATEFVEIYNRGTTTFNLSGWKFTDGSSTATLSNYNLAPNQYLIICPVADTASYSPYGAVMGVSSFPSLNNAGDNLYLKNNALVIIDSVNYSDAWYQDAIKDDGGWTLELINPNVSGSCPASGNWIASVNTNGGTPGIQNSVYSTAADVTAPSIVSVSVLDSTHISVCFSEAIDAFQLTVVGNYSVNNGIGSASSAVSNSTGTCVDLTLSVPLNSSTTYTLSTTGLSDCSGNSLSPVSFQFDYYKVTPFDVVINEIMADPDASIGLPAIQYEYVELHNRTAYSINLNNWTYTAGTTMKVLPNINIAANGYVVLTNSTNSGTFPVAANAVGITSFPGLTNTGQSLALRSSQGVVISYVSYSDAWYQDAVKKNGGWSLEQIDPNNPCEGMNNWRASNNFNGGTPGSQNSVNASNPDNTAPKVVRVAIITNDTIQLFFNEPLDSLSLLNPALFTIDNLIGTPTQVVAVGPDFMSVRLSLATSIVSGIIYKVTVNNAVTDCMGNPVGGDNSARFALPQPAQAMDLVINEVLYDPNTGGVDFVEVYNRSDKVIDLRTMTLSQYDTVNNIPVFPEIISTDGYLIFPGDYVVLSENGDAVKSQYHTSNPEGFLDMSDLPTMSISGGTVCLAVGFTVIDHFTYYDYMQFPLLNVTKGVSLERIDFNRPTQDKTNWHSASEAVGYATPGYKNSQYNDSPETDNDIEISPEIFSPDEDGMNDIVNINYHFAAQGYVANVTIYDSKGRLIKNLVRNELLGINGTFSWDGITEERDKARIGIYIIFTEVFDVSGNVKHYKNTCVLAGKLD